MISTAVMVDIARTALIAIWIMLTRGGSHAHAMMKRLVSQRMGMYITNWVSNKALDFNPLYETRLIFLF